MNNRKLDKTKYRNNLDEAILNNLAYYKQVRNILDAHKTKAEHAEFRQKILDHHMKNNYQMEYDRIRSQLYDNSITLTARQYFENDFVDSKN